ncbi:hypothetical protein P2318_29185 [Myxococcaceae bacterium GXIMD 01537]
MPRAFNITAATDSVELDSAGRGEVSFTVSNALRTPVRARATVMTSGGARPEWAHVEGGEERDFPADGTQQLTVRLQAPPGTAPGRYAVQLLVADVANPDERYAQGPMVAFTMPVVAPPPARKRFPWALVALVAGVLLILGTVVAVLLGPGGAKLGESCAETGCGENLLCAEDTKVCLGQEGFLGCAENAQCVTTRCTEGECVKVPPGSNCGAAGRCPPEQSCTDILGPRSCLLVSGQACDGNVQCTSVYCREGQCTRDDGKCESDAECKSPFRCQPNKLCMLPDLATCTSSALCASGFCSGQCRPPSAPCTPACRGDFNTCLGGRCVSRPDGMMALPEYRAELRRIASGGARTPAPAAPRPSSPSPTTPSPSQLSPPLKR